MRTTLTIAANCLRCGLRGRGIWFVILGSALPMIFVYILLAVIPREAITVAAQLTAAVRGEDVAEARDVFGSMTESDYQDTLVEMTVSGSLKVIGGLATLLAVFFATYTNEAARRSVASVLAHPIRRVAVPIGAFLGTLAVTLPATWLMTLIAFLLSLLRTGEANWGFLAAGGYVGASLVPVVAYSVLFTTALNGVVGPFVAVGHAWIASKTYSVALLMEGADSFLRWIGRGWFALVPRLGDFGTMAIDMASRLSPEDTIAPTLAGPIWQAFALAAVHSVVALVLASVSLGRREF